MRLPILVRVPMLLAWLFIVMYPNPAVLVRSIANLRSPDVDAAAVRQLARVLPDDPRLVEQAVLQDIIPYAYDWQVDGVPWYFPSTREALRAGRGDCESRAVVLASILKAKGIPYHLRMSFDHIWVDYPGKQANSMENDAVAMGEQRDGRFVLSWPRQFDAFKEFLTQASFYWTPMPPARKLLVLAGLLVFPLWNVLAAAAGRRAGRGGRLQLQAMTGRGRRWVAPDLAYGRVRV